MTTNHPIDPTLPRAGWLATVELNTGTKKTRYFPTSEASSEWVVDQIFKGNVVWTEERPVTK